MDLNHNQLIFQPCGDDKKPSMLADLLCTLQGILQAIFNGPT